MKHFGMYYRVFCLLCVFWMYFCASFVSAQTNSTVDVSGVVITEDDGFTQRTNFVTNSEVFWTATPYFLVTEVLFRPGSSGTGYRYGENSSIRKMLAIPNTQDNNSAQLTSSWLQNIESITFLIARTKAYGETNKVHIDVVRCASDYVPLDGDWTECHVVNQIEKYIDATVADAMVAAGYDKSQYDRVTYEFPTPCSGYIRIRIGNTNTTPYNTRCPYLLIPELTVVHNAPAPCSSCFSVTIR